MFRLLLLILFALIITGSLAYWIFFSKTPFRLTSSSQSNQTQQPKELPLQPPEEKVKNLEEELSSLSSEVKDKKEVVSTSPNSELEKKISQLESKIFDLAAEITRLKSQSNTVKETITVQNPKATTYIPLGNGISSTALDWTTISSYEFTLDPADYPGYKSMQLEIRLRVFQGNGSSHARLFNNTDGTAILPSEVSTTSQDYTWVTSSTFTLPSGKKTYRFQLKSLTGYEASINDSRIRVNF